MSNTGARTRERKDIKRKRDREGKEKKRKGLRKGHRRGRRGTQPTDKNRRSGLMTSTIQQLLPLLTGRQSGSQPLVPQPPRYIPGPLQASNTTPTSITFTNATSSNTSRPASAPARTKTNERHYRHQGERRDSGRFTSSVRTTASRAGTAERRRCKGTRRIQKRVPNGVPQRRRGRRQPAGRRGPELVRTPTTLAARDPLLPWASSATGDPATRAPAGNDPGRQGTTSMYILRHGKSRK